MDRAVGEATQKIEKKFNKCFFHFRTSSAGKQFGIFFPPSEKATHARCYITLLTRLRVAHSHFIHYECIRQRRRAAQADAHRI